MTGTARRKLALTVCGLALLAGCGSGASSGSTPSGAASATSSAAASPSSSVLCGDAATLRASLDKLRHASVQPGAAIEIISDLNDVKAALTTLVTHAHGQWQDQTSALSAALGTLGTAVSRLVARPGANTVSGVVAALGQVNTAAQNLLAAVNTDCPSAASSPSG